MIRYDPLDEEIEVELIDDDVIREETPAMGYYAMFEYENGFRKTNVLVKKENDGTCGKIFTCIQQMAERRLWNFRAGQIPEKDLWKYSSFWFKRF